jgi:integrase
MSALTDFRDKRLQATHKQFEIFDEKITGHAIRVSPGGTKSFVLLYRFRGKNRRLTLGRYPTLSLKDARQMARQALNEVSKGIDPHLKKISERENFDVSLFSRVAPDFVQNYARRNTKSWRETDRVLRTTFVPKWGRLQLQQISKRVINTLLNDIVESSGRYAANHAFAIIRRFFNWCVEQGHIDHSPCFGMKAPSRAAERDRILSDAELTSIWSATDEMGFPFGHHVKLQLLTAQRRTEISSLRWSDLDLQQRIWTQPAASNKSGRTHIVPFSNLALETILSMPRVHDELVFPARGRDNPVSGYSKWKRKLDHISRVTDWTLHDLRRTAATRMASLDVPLHVIELVLNHRSKSLSGVAGIYNRHEYLDEQRDALEQWARHVETLVLKAQDSADDAATEPGNFQAQLASARALHS